MGVNEAWLATQKEKALEKTAKRVKRMVSIDGKESLSLSQTEDPVVFA